jgi:hypothetical protein
MIQRVHMSLKKAFLGCVMAFVSTAYADNHHSYPEAANAQGNKLQATAQPVKAKYAGYCEIEIINNSFGDVRVSGVFDDGTPLYPFTVYSFESPHYISLFYYGYCHAGMNLYIDNYYGYNIYSGYTRAEATVRIYPFLKDQVKAEVVAR